MTQSYIQVEKDIAADVAERLLGNATFNEAYVRAVNYLALTRMSRREAVALGPFVLSGGKEQPLKVSALTMLRIYDVAKQRGDIIY